MRVRLAPTTRVLDHGHLLLAGSPLTVQRLRRPITETTHDTTLGRRWLATGLGEPVLDCVALGDPDQLTVVVPAHGRPAGLARCVAALAPLRVVVVDDASEPPLPGAYVRLPHNQGPAAARNAGLARVTTPYVALVDSDITVSPTALLSLARHFQDADVALVGPRIRGRTDGTAWWQRYDAAFSALDLGAVSAPVRPGSLVSYLPSACLVARADDVRAAGGFDESMRVGEDVDLVWRLVAAGRQVRYDAGVEAHHDGRDSTRKWLTAIAGYGTSAAPLAARHGRSVAPAVLAPATAAAAAALLLRRRWSVPLAGAVVVHQAHRLQPTLPTRAAIAVAARGLGWAVRQETALLLRHWCPATLAACAISRAARRATASALVVYTALALGDRRGLPVPALLGGRLLTDLAYGTGVWLGAARHRSARVLIPRRPASA